MESAVDIHPQAFARTSRGMLSMGLTAEQLASAHGIERRRQEEFALASHEKAARADAGGLFDDEIVRVVGHDEAGAVMEAVEDQSIRRDTSLEAMATLEPVFLPKLGTITAATSAPLSDGASALVVMSEAEALRQSLEPLARVVATAVVGVSPAAMGTGPIHATRKLLARVAGRGISLADIDLIELNEAFAAQSLAVIQTLGLDPAKVNPMGGAIALGHPLGATGAIRSATVVHALRRHGLRYGMVTMCVGMGQGAAGIFERV